jgi:hypothetical protein
VAWNEKMEMMLVAGDVFPALAFLEVDEKASE